MAAEQYDVQAQIEEPEQQEPERRYSEMELVRLVEDVIQSSQSMENGEIDSQRQLAIEYYYGMRPSSQGLNTSDYVSWEVFESVEAMKARLIRAFSSNRKVVRWKPTSEKDVELADMRTKAVNAIMDGKGGRVFKILHDIFHDAGVAKLAAVKRVHRTRKVRISKRFTDIPSEQLEAAAMDDSVISIEIEEERYADQQVQTEMGPSSFRQKLASGTVLIEEDRSGIEIDVLAPECVHFSNSVTDLSEPDKIPAVAIRYYKPRYQLIEEGFDPEIVQDLQSYNQTPTTGSAQARTGFDATNLRSSNIKDNDEIEIDECFIWIDMETPRGEPSQGASLWQIVKSGETYMASEAMEELPMRFWTPYMVSHKAIGQSMADVSIDIQAGTTAATRGVIDNVHRVNAGVRLANFSQIINQRDLIDNPIGAVIDTSNPMTAVNVMPQPAVSPATMGLLQLFNEQKEQRTGDTRLGRGLGAQDVVTHQNSADMIDQILDAGGDRPAMMAHSFAELFWKPLMLDVYKLAVDNKVKTTIEIDGTYQEIDISQIPYSDKMEIDVALTPDAGDQNARKLLAVHQIVGADPMVAPLYTLEERYAVYSEIFHLIGTANWLANPKDPQVMQRMQLMQKQKAEAEAMQKQMLAKEVQLREREVATKEGKVKVDAKLKKEDLDLEAAMGATEQNLKEREFQWEMKTDVAEFQLEKEQARAVALGDNKTPKG